MYIGEAVQKACHHLNCITILVTDYTDFTVYLIRNIRVIRAKKKVRQTFSDNLREL